jgi:putative transposase
MKWRSDAVQCTSSPLHLYNRGVNGERIFLDAYDYKLWLDLMAKFLPLYQIELLVYALMPNHYHITLIQRVEYEVSRFLQQVCWRYVKSFNRRHRRYGSLFAGRFGLEIVQGEAGLLRLSHYIHMNPVTAKLCDTPQSWPYSSCGAYFNSEDAIPSIKREPLIQLVGGPEEYRRFLAEYNSSDPLSIFRFMKDGK